MIIRPRKIIKKKEKNLKKLEDLKYKFKIETRQRIKRKF